MAFGVASGTAIYQYLFSAQGTIDFYKVAFVGVLTAICVAIQLQIKKTVKKDQG